MLETPIQSPKNAGLKRERTGEKPRQIVERIEDRAESPSYRITKFEYNEQGLLVRTLTTWEPKKADMPTSQQQEIAQRKYEVTFEYDDSKRLLARHCTATVPIRGTRGKETRTLHHDVMWEYTKQSAQPQTELFVSGSTEFTIEYTYDKEDRLVRERKTGGTSTSEITYAYDQNGRLASKRTVDDMTKPFERWEEYVYQGAHLVRIEHGTGTGDHKTSYGTTLYEHRKDTEVETYFYGEQMMWRTTTKKDAQQQVVESTYESFSNPRKDESISVTKFKNTYQK